jgi:AcrR family transcriptional regulator
VTAARERLLDKAVAHLAEHGVGDVSLRTLAAGVGTSHRMLLYHFGSREGLLSAVVDRVERAQRDSLAELIVDADAGAGADLAELGRRYWARVTEAALIYGPLFFELSGQAMQGRPHAAALRGSLIRTWLEPLAELWRRAGYGPAEAAARARLGLAVARGLLFDLLITGDRAGVDAAMELFAAGFAAPT